MNNNGNSPSQSEKTHEIGTGHQSSNANPASEFPQAKDEIDGFRARISDYTWMSYDRPLFPPEPVELHASVLPPEISPEIVKPTGSYWRRRLELLRDPKLTLKAKFRSLPVVGFLLAWANAFIKLGVTRHHHSTELHQLRVSYQQLQQRYQQAIQISNDKILHLNHRLAQLEPYLEQAFASIEGNANRANLHTYSLINELNTRVEKTLSRNAERLHKLESVKAGVRLQRFDFLDVGQRLMKLEQAELGRKFKHLTQLLQVEQKQRQIEMLELKSLRDQLSQLKGVEVGMLHSAQTFKPDPTYDFDSDTFYKAFEDRFRGTRAEIKERLRAYLPYVESIANKREQDRKLFVDVGCGRGEWLELLAQENIPSIGIDMNQVMVQNCINEGLAAKTDDAIQFLKRQEESSLSGVSGFHIIEHLAFDRLVELFDAALYALEDGGVVIFETPNPENLIIGACNFYYDPTHLHPIVPAVAEFIAQQRGFRRTEIVRLHPFPPDYQMPGDSPADKAINKFLFSAQDYAIVAWK